MVYKVGSIPKSTRIAKRQSSSAFVLSQLLAFFSGIRSVIGWKKNGFIVTVERFASAEKNLLLQRILQLMMKSRQSLHEQSFFSCELSIVTSGF